MRGRDAIHGVFTTTWEARHDDYWVVKISSNGTKQWDKRFGGKENEVIRSIALTADGNYLLAGSSFASPVSGPVRIVVYNLLGDLVQTVYQGQAEAGQTHQYIFTKSGLKPGIYLCRLVAGTRAVDKKWS